VVRVSFSGSTQGRQRDQFNGQQETLTTLAHDTGGKALLDDNELSDGITQAQQDMRSYYILGYYSTNALSTASIARCRSAWRNAARRIQARLSAGIFQQQGIQEFTAVDKERQLEEALLLGDL
jgi:hypothetical protein